MSLLFCRMKHASAGAAPLAEGPPERETSAVSEAVGSVGRFLASAAPALSDL